LPQSSNCRFIANGIDTSAFASGIHVLRVKALSQKGVWSDVAVQPVRIMNEAPYDFEAHLEDAKISGKGTVAYTELPITEGAKRVLLQSPESSVTFKKVPVYEHTRLSFGIGLLFEGAPEEQSRLLLNVVANADKPLFTMLIDPESYAQGTMWLTER